MKLMLIVVLVSAALFQVSLVQGEPAPAPAAEDGLSLEKFLGEAPPELTKAVSSAVDKLKPVVENLNKALKDAPVVGQILTPILQTAVDSLLPKLQELLKKVGEDVGKLTAALGKIVDCLLGALETLTAELPKIESDNLVSGVTDLVKNITDSPAVKEVLDCVTNGLKEVTDAVGGGEEAPAAPETPEAPEAK